MMMHLIGQLALKLYHKAANTLRQYIARQQASDPTLAAIPVRREAGLFCTMLPLTGALGGISFGPPLACVSGMGPAAMGLLVSCVGGIVGVLLGRLYKERYKRVCNAWPMLLGMSFFSYLLSCAVSALLLLMLAALVTALVFYVITLVAPIVFWIVVIILLRGR